MLHTDMVVFGDLRKILLTSHLIRLSEISRFEVCTAMFLKIQDLWM
jgi:hypothetical protein